MGSVPGAASVEALEADIEAGRIVLDSYDLAWFRGSSRTKQHGGVSLGLYVQWNRSTGCSPRDILSHRLSASPGLGWLAGLDKGPKLLGGAENPLADPT